MKLIMTVVFGVLAVTAAAQQTAPAFEVASVKQSVVDDTSYSFRASRGTVEARNMTLRLIIGQAYAPGPPFIRPPMEPYQILAGGDSTVLDRRFDIVAKGPDDASPEQLQVMLRQLLADRFNLKIHTEVRQQPVYVLRVAREGQLGPDMRPSQHDCRAFRAAGGKRDDPASPRDASGEQICFAPLPTGDRFTMDTTVRSAGPITDLMLGLQQALDRPLIDGTGLSALYEWKVTFSRVPVGSAFETQRGDDIFAALPKQLGLRLETRTGPLEVPVIDSVQMPTPN